MSNQEQDNKTTIKKAAPGEGIPLLQSDMFITNIIVPEQHSALDIDSRSSAANGRCRSLQLNEQTRFGGEAINETLMQCAGESYVKLEDNVPSLSDSYHLTNDRYNTRPTPNKPTLLTGGSPPLTSVKTGIDYLTLLSDNMYYGTWRSWLTKWFKGDAKHQGQAPFYKNRRHYPETGIQVCTECKENPDKSMVTIPGGALRTLTFEQQAELLSDAIEQGFKFSRLDLYVDFIGEDVWLVESVREWAMIPGNMRLKVDPRQDRKDGVLGGCTVYLGARQSNRMWRCYDKGAEQGAKNNKHQRFELELHRDYAVQAGNLINKEEGLRQKQEIIPSLVFADIWAKDLKWWSELRSIIKPDPLPSREKPSLVRYLTYMKKSVLPKIRMLADELGVRPKDIFSIILRTDPDNSMSPSIKNTNLISEFKACFIDKPSNIHQDAHADFVGTNHNRRTYRTSESVSVMCNSQKPKNPSYPIPNRSPGESDQFGISKPANSNSKPRAYQVSRSPSPAPLEGVKRE